LELTPEEWTWLDQLTGAPGFAITCRVQRWWRETRLRRTVRLTLAALCADQSAELIASYLDRSRCPSLFFIPEAVGFLDWVIGEGPAVAHLGAIARFERAIILAAEAAPAPPRPEPHAAHCSGAHALRLKPHPAAAIVEFAAQPERVIGALLSGDPMPRPDGPTFPVLVAPGLTHLWRPATPNEARIFARCQPSAAADALLVDDAELARPLRDLLGVSALCPD
jgi:hypothetical protein